MKMLRITFDGFSNTFLNLPITILTGETITPTLPLSDNWVKAPTRIGGPLTELENARLTASIVRYFCLIDVLEILVRIPKQSRDYY